VTRSQGPYRGRRLQLVGGTRPGSSWSLLLNLPAYLRSRGCFPFGGVALPVAALDGETGRDQQQCERREVADINAVRRSERDQDFALWERFNDHEPDGDGGQREGLEPAAAALGRSRHLQMVTARC
jgi:hypothetical protein